MACSTRPKISVVTVNFNMAGEICPTLDSVLAQDYPNFESIVIDGGSTDGSRDIIASYGARLAHWVSERDRNLYDGMNKGVRAASGEWLLFMNSGDQFVGPQVLSCIFSGDHSDADIVYGHHVRRYSTQGIDRVIKAESPQVLPLRMHCSHQSLFMRREILINRPFSQELLVADYEAILLAYIEGWRFKLVDCVVAVIPVGGRSDKHRLTSLWQRVSVLRRLRQMTLRRAVYYAWLMARILIAAMVKKLIPTSVFAFVLRHRPIKGLG